VSERVPILRIGNVLLVSIQTDLDDETVLNLQEDLADRTAQFGARGVVIDISAVEIVDSFVGRMLANIAAISRVMDAETVVVGMRPAVAITLVELGLTLGGVRTALSLEKVLRDFGSGLDAGARDESGEWGGSGELSGSGGPGRLAGWDDDGPDPLDQARRQAAGGKSALRKGPAG
jgi:rsbT antagonist protein RsbS